jgi:uncharacterized membrane protein
MKGAPGTIGRALQPLAVMLWVFFLVVSVAAGVVWAFGIGDAHLAEWVGNKDLSLTLQWMVRWLDFTWIVLGAINVYVCLAAREGLGQVRAWTMMVFVGVLALVMASNFSGYPLGRIQYSVQLGPKIGLVPIGLPFLWLTLFGGARETALRLFPKISYGQAALIAALLVLLLDLSLEPLAAKLRGWWFWRATEAGQPPTFTAPLLTSLAWGLAGWLTALQLRERDVVGSARPRSWRPVVVLAVFQGVFLAAHLGRWVRN